jgi:spore coat polysaccharide biosynthesis protein SpsF
MKVCAIIQARMRSTRFPGKILAPLAGKPILEIIYRRIQHSQIDSLWLATSADELDDLTAHWGESLGIRVYRGATEDVLSRFTNIANYENPNWILRLTSDNPFVNSEIINKLISEARNVSQSVKYISSGESRSLPLGYVPEIIRTESLIKSESEIPNNQFYHRCHVTSWVKKNEKKHELMIPSTWKDRSCWRWTIDTPEDYEMARKAFNIFGDRYLDIDYITMVDILDSLPEITNINQNIRQKSLEEG